MADLQWLDHYSGETLEELLALESEYRIDSLVVAMGQALDQKAAENGEQSLSDEERVILAVDALERDVNNGGYSQFFSNSSGEYAAMIVNALLSIRCPETASITQDAIEALGIEDFSPEALEEAIESEDDARDERLEECDGLYYGTGEDIAGQLFEFVRANQDAIEL
jgi:predicted DNA-binding protein